MITTKAKLGISEGIVAILMLGTIVGTLWWGDSRERAQARGKRMVERHVAEPVALTNGVTSVLPGVVPKGFQVFDNVPLQINGMICLWGEGGASKGANYPKEVLDIPVNQIFQTLYVYHGSYYGSPPGTPVCDVVLRYVDGTSATNRLLYGNDILDWFAPGGNRVRGPTGTNSKLAWIGQLHVRNGGIQQLRYCITAIKNPHPHLMVSTIDLYSCRHRTVACIMAMTTGKEGLMDDSLPTDGRKK